MARVAFVLLSVSILKQRLPWGSQQQSSSLDGARVGPTKVQLTGVRDRRIIRRTERTAGGCEGPLRAKGGYSMTRRAMFVISAVLLLMLGLMLVPAWAGDVFVNGYTRKDGTYVAPHLVPIRASTTTLA
jgi:hypothetical protein